MITYADSGAVRRARNPEIPGYIQERRAFSNFHQTFQGFTDTLGNYVIYSYYEPVVRILPDGRVDWTKKRVYAGHREVIEQGLNEGGTNG